MTLSPLTSWGDKKSPSVDLGSELHYRGELPNRLEIIILMGFGMDFVALGSCKKRVNYWRFTWGYRCFWSFWLINQTNKSVVKCSQWGFWASWLRVYNINHKPRIFQWPRGRTVVTWCDAKMFSNVGLSWTFQLEIVSPFQGSQRTWVSFMNGQRKSAGWWFSPAMALPSATPEPRYRVISHDVHQVVVLRAPQGPSETSCGWWVDRKCWSWLHLNHSQTARSHFTIIG